MRYGRHTTTEFKALIIVIVMVWVLTALFTPQIVKIGHSVESSIQAAFKK